MSFTHTRANLLHLLLCPYGYRNFHLSSSFLFQPSAMTDNNPNSTSMAALLDRKVMRQYMANGNFSQTLRSNSASPRTQVQIFTEPYSQRCSSGPASPTLQSNEKKRAHISLDNSGQKQPSTAGAAAARAPATGLDPKVLLNPRLLHSAARRKDDAFDTASSSEVETPPQRPISATPHFIFDSANQDPLLHEDTESEGGGYGKLIEQVHNVTKREDRPVKRQKTAHPLEGDVNGSSAFAGGGRGGEIGEYMKQKRKEGLQESGPASHIVDLTAGSFRLFLRSIKLIFLDRRR